MIIFASGLCIQPISGTLQALVAIIQDPSQFPLGQHDIQCYSYGSSNHLVPFSLATEVTLVWAQTRNVVLFGECGVGKSSVINLIAGLPVAKTSNDVLGCTDENRSYSVILETGIKVNLWDTIGLDEGTAGRIPADKARQRLKQLLHERIAASEGPDLLLYCIRGASDQKILPVKQGHWEKYIFVFEEICKKRIPMAMIVTCLESYNPKGDMDAWWDHSEGKIREFGFQLCAHACIATLPPELWGTGDDASRIEVSRRRLQDLLSSDILPPRNVLLIGVRQDRGDFIDIMNASFNKRCSVQNVKDSSPFTCDSIAFGVHDHTNLWNTNGFDDTDDDALITKKNLKFLVQGIKQTPSIDLLLFCFRAGRVRSRHVQAYKLFHAALCRKKVSVAIAILGPQDQAETWWRRNEQDLKQRGLRFVNHVYIPCDASQLCSSGLSDAARHQLICIIQERYTLGSWKTGNDPFWVTVPNVRAVVGELSWPTTTVVICDNTTEGTFANIAPGVQFALQHAATSPHREHRFQRVDPQSFSPILDQSSGSFQSRISSKGNRGISLIMFFMPAEEPDSETWRTLERFHATYKGDITPLIVVVCGVPEKRLADDFWRVAPFHIRKWIGAQVTHYPGVDACPEARVDAQELIVDMIQDQSLVDLGEKVGVLQEILSIWRKYRSQRDRALDGAAR